MSASVLQGDSGTIFRLVYRSHSRIGDARESEEFGRILRSSRANNAVSGDQGSDRKQP